jgi:uncharacterized membrane protein
MGYKWEVNVWDSAVDSDYFYWLQIYAGDSLLKAIYYMWWAKRNGWHCIKLEYRP